MEGLSTKQKGDISELRVMSKLTGLGIDVYLPYGEDSRADLIADTGDELLKIQVKTAHTKSVRDTAIEFNCYSSKSNFTESEDTPYGDEIDGFAVFWPKQEELYYIPVADAPDTKMTIRRIVPDNNQTARINFGDDYEFTERFI